MRRRKSDRFPPVFLLDTQDMVEKMKFPLFFYMIFCYTLFCNTRYGEFWTERKVWHKFLRTAESGENRYDLCN